MVSIRIETLKKYLKRGARAEDKALFNMWMYGQISTDDCIRYFRKNNKITERMPIVAEEFEEWLGTLGYRRGE